MNKSPNLNDTMRLEDWLPVKEARAKLQQAESREANLAKEAGEIEAAVNPNPATMRRFTEEEVINAELRRPGVRQELFLARQKVKALREESRQATVSAVEELRSARTPGRKALMKKLFALLGEAATVAAELASHDEQTMALSGGAIKLASPWPEFIANGSGESKLNFRRRVYAEWLD